MSCGGSCGKCPRGICGEGREMRSPFPPTCCSSGGCFLHRRAPHFCCRDKYPAPQICPAPLPRSSPPPITLPLCCYKPTAEACSQAFIIHAIRTACRPTPQPCSDCPCGPKGTIINFAVPNTGIRRLSDNVCPTGLFK